jgi:hypothetical protein
VFEGQFCDMSLQKLAILPWPMLTFYQYGYSASLYESVLQVQIHTGYAGDCGSLPQPMNMIYGKVPLQMILRTLCILIFIMISCSGDDIIVGAAAVGLID